MESDSLVRRGLVESERTLRVDEGYEALIRAEGGQLGTGAGRACGEKTHDVLVGNVSDLLQDAAADGVADLFGSRLRVLKTPS